MTGKGHEERFAPTRLSGRSAFSEETFVGRVATKKMRRKRASRIARYSFVQIIYLGRVRIEPDDRPCSAGVVVGEDAMGARWYTVKRHAGLASGHAIAIRRQRRRRR